MAKVRGPFDPEPPSIASWLIPAGSIMLGSMVTLLPVVATFPILPPLGLMMLVGWRLGRAEALPIWSALLLGLFDDLFSGQPFGSAMLFWTLTVLIIDLFDQRLVSRDFWQDWLLASGAIAGCLIAGRMIAVPIGAHVDTVLLLQAAASVMLYPAIARLCAWLDEKRTPE
ncbi:MAG: rod shape-determining protein MreD [Sphingomonas sp. 28-66-16]|nr:MAG: rod shape-determining protein MreD [Sphingomonas sp. 28-66-16]